ncbi:hypothetical protein [uncultured Jatrophihabitans sp.]|uniref:hypothetical protein n=1 Tax=uncultured Jatrophihabitans sp. TaxID=1610747 RepID=UPI0035CAD6FA
MSYGLRRTLLGALGGAAVLIVLGLYYLLAQHVLPFAILSFALATPLVAGALRVVIRLRAGDAGVRLAAREWNGPGALLLVSRPLASADDLLRKYLVEVDGHRVAELGYGDATELDIAAGRHSVQALLGGSDKKSQRVEITSVAGHRSHVQVEPFAASTAVRKAADEWIVVSEAQ